jgi:hypothetical protein
MMKYLLVGIFSLLLVAGCASAPETEPSPGLQATSVLASNQDGVLVDPAPLKPVSQVKKSSLIEEIQAHTDLYRSVMLAEPGWVHLIIRPAGYDKTNITHTEAESYEEGWYLLDDQAQVLSAIETLVDERGQTKQIFIFKDGGWWDASNGEAVIRGAPQYFEQGEIFYQQAGRLLEQGEKLSSQTIYSNCWYIGEQYTISDGKFLREAVFDPAMGNFKALKTWERDEDTIELVSGIDVLKEERVTTPPAEMVALFEEAP